MSGLLGKKLLLKLFQMTGIITHQEDIWVVVTSPIHRQFSSSYLHRHLFRCPKQQEISLLLRVQSVSLCTEQIVLFALVTVAING